MNDAATEFDVGPLTWVKGEIDLALARAGDALAQFSASGDATQFRFARTHLHQVRGALAIVGLDGLTQFIDSVEGLLGDFEQHRAPTDAAGIALAQRAIDLVRHYLDDLVNGEPDQPLKLLPVYSEILLVRGEKRSAATDLFFPDLSPPPRPAPASPLPREALQQHLRAQRSRFQRGLLAWLRNPGERAGVAEMIEATREVEATQEIAAARAFWWAAAGMLTALAEGRLPAGIDIKQLCARIDLQIRRLIEGSKNVAERLMRDTLYQVAHADSDDPLVREVQDAYRLRAMLPTAPAAEASPQESRQRRLREAIAAAEEAWSRFCAGTAQSLPAFREQATTIHRIVDSLGHTDYRRLARAIANAADWLLERPSRHSEGLAMEIATAIILAQNAQENFSRLGADFAHQVDVMVARLHGFLAGTPLEAGTEVPVLDELTRQAQEKLLVGQVVKEIQGNLAQIEQVLDGFFRDPGRRNDLDGLEGPLHQVAGALTMMGESAAVDALAECEADIRRFAADESEPTAGDFERVADRLSALGFFIDAIAHGATDFAGFTRAMSVARAGTEAGRCSGGAAGSVEQELERTRQETRVLLHALKDRPADEGLRQEIRQNLETLRQDADLVADSALGRQAKAALSALSAGAAPVLADLGPLPAAAPPSPAAQQLAQAGEEALDAELLAIFIEEAKEVLAAVSADLDRLREEPHDVEVLTNVRRSFHTLKGSGRMVNLRELGEVAWAVEQVLNLWLRQELELTQQVFEMIGEGCRIFTAWVAHLETREEPLPDAAALVALAGSLRTGEAPKPSPGLVAAGTIPPAGPGEAEGMNGAAQPADEGETAEAVPDNVVHLVDFGHQDPMSAAAAAAGAGDETGGQLGEQAGEQPADPSGQGAAEALPPSPSRGAGLGISPTLYDIFLEEARTHIATLHREFAAFAADPTQPTPFPMARAAHTLAGISGTVGIEAINHLGHALEHALRRRETTGRPESAGAVDTLGQAIDVLAAMVDEVAAGNPPEAQGDLSDRLAALYPPPAHGASGMVPAADDGEAVPGSDDEAGWAGDAGDIGEAGEAKEAGQTVAATTDAAADDWAMDEAIAPAAAPAGPAAGISADLDGIVDEIDEQLLPIFLEEAAELIAEIGDNLRAWRAVPEDPETLRTLHRLFHTMKGSARMAGAMMIGEVTHAIESRLERAGRNDSVSPALIDDVETAFDGLAQAIERLARGETLMPESFRTAQAPGPAPAAEPGEAATDDEAPLAGADDDYGITDEAPGGNADERTHESADEGANRAANESGDAAGAPAPAAVAGDEAGGQKAVIRVRASLVDQLVNQAGELSIARTRIEGEMGALKESLLDLTENVIRLRRQLRDIEIQAETQMQSRIAQTGEAHADFDPLEFDRFTHFQELARMMAESVNDVATVQQGLLKNLDDANAALLAQARMNRQLQQALMSVRMVPFASQADRLHRIVRQTAKELGKRASLDIRGGQVEMDRSVLDKIGPSLEHLLRNAVAHGLEAPAARLAAGKPEGGEVTLTLAQESNEIIISMEDDGVGLDFERIRARGIEAGLLAPDEEVDEGRLIKLIFAPGFSTVAEVNRIAGRGVGMDVVKAGIGDIGGRIEVHSAPGKGTTFRLYIPLTLAVTQALLARAGGDEYAIPSSMIEQVLDLKEARLSQIRADGEVEWLGNRYPYHFLPQLLGDDAALPEARRQYWLLLLRSGMQRVAVQVDELRGNREIVVKNVGAQLSRVVGIAGATVLGDGRVVLILNPVALASRARMARIDGVVAHIPAAARHQPLAALPTVLVVDDSLTVRKITSRLLTREGYRVLTAKDGVDALEQMLDTVPDVLLADIEMPRMDGFDLVRNVRADERLKHVPVIMITSRTAEKHRKYAFEIGVNHYLGKPYDEDELLARVGECTNTRKPAACGPAAPGFDMPSTEQ